MPAFALFACSLLVALGGVAGIYIFAGLPGAGDFVPANQTAAMTAGILLVAAVGVGAACLMFFANRK